MNSTAMISSPWFYLQPNDIIYVTPNKTKIAATDAYRNRNITIIAGAISLLTLLIARIINF